MSNPIQNQYVPDVVSPPGETLLEILEDRGMSQAELAERTGRPKKTINEIIKGKAALTPETAIQLERVLGTPASFWNNREQNYRDWLARQEERKALAYSPHAWGWTKSELARRDEIISRLKEDAEKLSEHLILDSKGYFPHIQEQIRLDILAHRALMKELE